MCSTATKVNPSRDHSAVTTAAVAAAPNFFSKAHLSGYMKRPGLLGQCAEFGYEFTSRSHADNRGGSATPKSKSHRLHVRVGAVFGTKSSAAARQSPVLRRSSLPVLRVPPLPSWPPFSPPWLSRWRDGLGANVRTFLERPL